MQRFTPTHVVENGRQLSVQPRLDSCNSNSSGHMTEGAGRKDVSKHLEASEEGFERPSSLSRWPSNSPVLGLHQTVPVNTLSWVEEEFRRFHYCWLLKDSGRVVVIVLICRHTGEPTKLQCMISKVDHKTKT